MFNARTHRDPASPDGEPHGHVIGRGAGDPQPAPLASRLRGHVIARVRSARALRLLGGQPHGHVVGNAAATGAPHVIDDRPRGHVVGQTANG